MDLLEFYVNLQKKCDYEQDNNNDLHNGTVV